MNIALDFDMTLTELPTAFKQFIETVEADGHKVWLVTARRDTEENREIVREFMKDYGIRIPAIFTGLASKTHHMKERGIKIDIWIDDSPETLVHGH